MYRALHSRWAAAWWRRSKRAGPATANSCWKMGQANALCCACRQGRRSQKSAGSLSGCGSFTRWGCRCPGRWPLAAGRMRSTSCSAGWRGATCARRCRPCPRTSSTAWGCRQAGCSEKSTPCRCAPARARAGRNSSKRSSPAWTSTNRGSCACPATSGRCALRGSRSGWWGSSRRSGATGISTRAT